MPIKIAEHPALGAPIIKYLKRRFYGDREIVKVYKGDKLIWEIKDPAGV